MKIWILNHYALTPDMSGGMRHFELSREMVKHGHDVTILASSFNHSERREVRLATGETWEIEEVEGVKFVWLRTFPYQSNDWRRGGNMVSYMVHSCWLGSRLPRLDERIPVADVGCGLLVDPIDTQAIAESIQWLLEHPAEAEAMGQRGRKAVKVQYNWELENQKLLHLYGALLQ